MEEKVMKKFLSKNIHWLLIIFVMINLIIGFTNFTYLKQDIIAIFFGMVGLLGVTYLAFHIEVQKRREKEEK
jgi:cell division protein FtsW (lipid II flippase)